MTPTATSMPAWLESAWLARYLDRQLGDEELAWFEAYLMDKPELLGMVEADNMLADTVQAKASADSSSFRGRAASAAKSPSDRETPAVSFPEQAANASQRSRKRLAPQAWLALAASLVGVTVGWVGNRVASPGQQDPFVIANPERITFDTMRGSPTAARTEHGSSHSCYALIEVAVPPSATNITMAIDGRERTELSSSSDGFVTFLIERSARTEELAIKIQYELSGVLQTKIVSLPLVPEVK